MLRRKYFFILTLLLIFSAQVGAHPLDVGFLKIEEQQNELIIKLEVNPIIGCQILKLSDDCLSKSGSDFVMRKGNEFFNATIKMSSPQINKESCRWQDDPKLELESSTVLSLKVKSVCKSINGQLLWSFPFMLNLASTYSLIAKVRILNQERVLGVDHKQPYIDLAILESNHDFLHFVHLGLEHIGLNKNEWQGPEGFHFPAGIDHILFVVGLVLASISFVGVVKTVTGFTLGHLVTLTLASFQLIYVPSQLVEIAIAISIAIVAAESLWLKKFRSQWRLAFVFGLIHGLGFASAIKQLQLDSSHLIKALFGFNLGIEIGQIAIVFLFYPMIYFTSKSLISNRIVIKGAALLIFCLGVYWTIQRIFFF